MRTTIDLDERVLVAARALAVSERVSLGVVVSRLALAGLRSAPALAPDGFPTFQPPSDAPPITLDVVNDHRDDD